MNKNTWSILALTAGFAAIAACSASNATPIKPRGAAGAGTAGAGTAGVGTAGVGTAGVGTAGVGTAGVGTAGAGTAGAGTAGAGTAGSPPMTGPLLDDLTDGENTIAPFGAPGQPNRVGYWYTYLSAGSTIWPMTDASGANPFIACSTATTNCHLGPGHTPAPAADYWAEANGTVVVTTAVMYPYAGMGFDLNDMGGVKGPYDATAYTGINFWGKASLATMVQFKVQIPSISKVADGGTCTAMCDDQFSYAAAFTTGWTQFNVPFAMLKQGGFGAVTTFTQNSITDVQWQINGSTMFDIAVDDITFF